MSIHNSKLLTEIKEAQIKQLMVKLELQLFGFSELTTNQKNAMKEAERDILEIVRYE